MAHHNVMELPESARSLADVTDCLSKRWAGAFVDATRKYSAQVDDSVGSISTRFKRCVPHGNLYVFSNEEIPVVVMDELCTLYTMAIYWGLLNENPHVMISRVNSEGIEKMLTEDDIVYMRQNGVDIDSILSHYICRDVIES